MKRICEELWSVERLQTSFWCGVSSIMITAIPQYPQETNWVILLLSTALNGRDTTSWKKYHHLKRASQLCSDISADKSSGNSKVMIVSSKPYMQGMSNGCGFILASCKVIIWVRWLIILSTVASSGHWMKTLNYFNDVKSTLIQVMAWCRQAPSHYLW